MDALLRVLEKTCFDQAINDEASVTKTIEMLLKSKKFDFNRKTPIVDTDVWKYVCSLNYFDAMKLMIEYGENPHKTCKGGFNGLHLVNGSQRGILCAKLLLSKGVNINAQSAWRYTPLHTACMCADVEYTRFLIENGADVNIINGDKWPGIGYPGYDDSTALIYACDVCTGADENNCLECVKLLLSNGAKYDPGKLSMCKLFPKILPYLTCSISQTQPKLKLD